TATLLVIEGEDHGRRFEISPPTATIGRGVHSTIRLNDSEVSRQHAIFESDSGRFRISDRGSSNGTWVNGQPIHGHLLTDGDRIQVGRSLLVYSPAEARDEATHIGQHVELLAANRNDKSNIINSLSPDVIDRTPVPQSSGGSGNLVVNLNTLYRISEEAVNPACSLETLLQRILDLTLSAVGADRGCMLLLEGNGKPVPTVFSTRQPRPDSPMQVSTTIVDFVLEQRQAVRTSNAKEDQRFAGQSIYQAGIREAICVPMPGHSDLLGTIYIDTTPATGNVANMPAAETFSDEHLQLVQSIGRQAALAIEAKRFEQALLKSERLAAMGQTAAMISHHVKNILQAVRGGSYLVEMGLGQDDTNLVRKGWDVVNRNQDRIEHLVTDMLSISKERQPKLTEASLIKTVADICESLQPRAEELGIQFDAEYDPSVPLCQFDEHAINRAILNVLVNAFDAVDGGEDARVLIQTQYDSAKQHMVVVISDNGPGIAPELLHSIFDAFESNKGARGTGLGLAVSQKILREHGGNIKVDSRVDQGSRFTLAWPKIEPNSDKLNSATMTG
ncbi:UNVERIFIED_CONTAM: hypothetical protein GTU68_061251, partial [Idotea baltica]|nr:hypothetical protein [Idotea baltica]